MQIKTSVVRTALLILWMALAVSCRGNGTVQIAPFPDQLQRLPASITVVNWNSEKGKHPEFAKDLTDLLQHEQPDIVFLQEAKTDLFEPERMGGYFAEAWSYPWPGGKSVGVVTLSRVPPVRIEPVPAKHGEFGGAAPKVSLVTEYPLPNGETLLAVNVHLLNFQRWSVKKIKAQLKDLKSIMANHSGPILMAGDFNTWSRKRLELVKKITREVKLNEVIDFPQGRTTGGSRYSFWNDVFGVDADLPLDRVFFFGLHPRSARVLDYATSDHRPILVKLSLPP